MLISSFFMFSVKKMDGGYYLAVLFHFAYYSNCLFVYTLSPSKNLNQPTKKDGASQVVQWQRIHLPVWETQEMLVQSLGWEDPLE